MKVVKLIDLYPSIPALREGVQTGTSNVFTSECISGKVEQVVAQACVLVVVLRVLLVFAIIVVKGVELMIILVVVVVVVVINLYKEL